MPDSNNQTLPPPSADGAYADKYVKWLIELIGKEKLLVTRSDLSKFTIDSLHEHYRINLESYDVEISHSKAGQGEDMYVILFNNLKIIAANQSERTILSYLQLTAKQFNQFKFAADNQINQIKRKQEEKRFKDTMVGVDQELEKFSSQNISVVDKAVEDVVQPEQTASGEDKAALTPNLVKPPLPDNLTSSEPAAPQSIPTQTVI